MSEKIESIKSEVLQTERFSPSTLVEDYHIELSLAQWICEELSNENPEIKMWYRAICPTCKEFIRGFSQEELSQVESASCENCNQVVELNDSSLFIYYKNNPKKKVLNASDKAADVKATPLTFYNGINKPPQDWLTKNPKNLIWHISDLHIRGPSLTLGNGHCEILKNKFLEILESRNSYLKDDVIVISGDCTDDGSVESDQCFQKFVQSLVALGAVEERIIFVPGNHDSWNGAKRAVLSLRSYIGGFNKEENLLHKFQVYPKRSLPKMFSSFLEKPLLEKKVAINGKDICFVAINTAIPNEMARGVFPVVCSNPRSNSEIKIAIMHHHLIDECSKTTLDGDVVYKIKWMRVLNPAPALNYLFTNNFSISLHGHKHLQYHKRESQLNSSQAFVHLMSAPSLFEKKYDQNNGNITEDNFIGFNVMCPKEEGFDFFFFRLQNWNYCLKHQDTGKY